MTTATSRSLHSDLGGKPPLPAKKMSSKSETCLLTPAEELDYDDVPSTANEPSVPIVPPKSKPNLPPKQKINKSQQDLERIESDFKTSLHELRKRVQEADADYDDLHNDDAVDVSSDDKRRSGAALREYEDYGEERKH